ncbi:nitrate reductase subunit alpha [Paraburkholderia hospita]|uniref:nitrate reductase (quinone) n=2 Tax=Paraburkholderia TaxID=1822464 RepID=A0AAN1JCZ1_9BURK|nr:nitrate reductase subunit alpha [Paraburkholderia hospita]AUT71551.1 nitrate reductase subunit alpha [Paraburkholderia hospita]EIM99447.1 nitrate reductase Z subunit alpha [Paraburkholderia hospita]OUL67731.1 nitrate reductase subunit alpha [Paraburkholderia hospita]OUL95767.1 nitrate reductase subunit alpha [Paraburkholderia hospita]SEI23307.1 respiratory nitrate reductase alpha subunit apoprotein [Paraburkholderia hospita]
MSHFLDRLRYFTTARPQFSDGHGAVTDEDRKWEDAYRQRWQHDKIVRSTHGVNCTGSCSWKIYVKGGIVTWETQQTDYPRTRPDMPNHEPRGCSRGASYSWYLYSANRLKYPLVRSALVKLWRERRRTMEPVQAWLSIVEDDAARRSYQSRRGLGGFIRATWDEVNEIVAAANVYTIKRHGPDRVVGFSPIPAMSMVSYAAGSRYLSLIGGVCLSFYDWYCDLPPASPQTWGEQTDVPESADWYNSTFIMMWGSNVPQTRTPDAHFMTEVRYKGTKIVSIFPDYAEGAKFGDIWLHPKQGTDAALALAMGHVILKEFHLAGKSDYFIDYCRRFTDMPCLVRLVARGDRYVPERLVRASDFDDALGQANNPEWKTVVIDAVTNETVVPVGSAGFRWGQKEGEDKGKWNLKEESASGTPIEPRLSFVDAHDEVADVLFPYFGNIRHPHFNHTSHASELSRKIGARRIATRNGDMLVATVYDLFIANYGLDQGLGGEHIAASYDDDLPYTPAWQEAITGVKRADVINVARQFAENAHKTQGKSMVIIGAGINHWFHMDMSYRAIINMLIMCGCVGKSGGGWSHYVGQEKLRPQTGWTPLAFALDWSRPPRQMNSTSFFYAHTDQWRYDPMDPSALLSPLADKTHFHGAPIDYNVRAERMGWLPSAPQLHANPLDVGRALNDPAQAGATIAQELKSGSLRMACEDPDNPANFPRNLFVWRSNLLGSSGKGHEYFLKHLLGTTNGVQGEEVFKSGHPRPEEITWHDDAPRGKLDLLVTLDFRMSTTCMYSDVVLPTATWYEKDDMNTSDMHPFIHPLSAAVDPAWQSKSDWEIFKGIAKRFSELSVGHLGVERDVVLAPIAHDSPAELAQPFDVLDWKRGECEPVPGKTMPSVIVVERDYPATYDRFTSLGPLMDKLGNGGKGITWDTKEEVALLGELNYRVANGQGGGQGGTTVNGTAGRPRIDTALDAAEVILSLAPETNGAVAVKAWHAVSSLTGIEHAHLADARADEKIRFRDIQAQPRKIISSPTWSGIESEHVSYNAGYTNVHELIPWRTLSGRQQLYQDHVWMQAFGEALCVYKPPIETGNYEKMLGARSNGNPEIVLNFITPHQKWGIHSTYTDNLLMLTLSRGGPIVWLSEIDARTIGVSDNDWIECYNVNGALCARAVVSQRIPHGMVMMYHAQEKIVNTPGSEITGTRGGIHNSVTRIALKPTHMIGGYAQLAYGFNYYGTVGSNRDEFLIVRKMKHIDWLDDAPPDPVNPATEHKHRQGETS